MKNRHTKIAFVVGMESHLDKQFSGQVGGKHPKQFYMPSEEISA
jgi:hypothetical protein